MPCLESTTGGGRRQRGASPLAASGGISGELATLDLLGGLFGPARLGLGVVGGQEVALGEVRGKIVAGCLVDEAQGFGGGAGGGGAAPQGREQLVPGHGVEEGEGGLEGVYGGLVHPQELPQQPLELPLAQLCYCVGVPGRTPARFPGLDPLDEPLSGHLGEGVVDGAWGNVRPPLGSPGLQLAPYLVSVGGLLGA